jgi:hypothetical protein
VKPETRRDIAWLVGLATGAVLIAAGIIRDEFGLITSGAGMVLGGELWGHQAPRKEGVRHEE